MRSQFFFYNRIVMEKMEKEASLLPGVGSVEHSQYFVDLRQTRGETDRAVTEQIISGFARFRVRQTHCLSPPIS